jgi:hypothetical protein
MQKRKLADRVKEAFEANEASFRKLDYSDEKVHEMVSDIRGRKQCLKMEQDAIVHDIAEKALYYDNEIEGLQKQLTDLKKKKTMELKPLEEKLHDYNTRIGVLDNALDDMTLCSQRMMHIKNLQKTTRCIVCQLGLPTVQFSACKCQVVCNICFLKLCTNGTSQIPKCPHCRMPIEEVKELAPLQEDELSPIPPTNRRGEIDLTTPLQAGARRINRVVQISTARELFPPISADDISWA